MASADRNSKPTGQSQRCPACGQPLDVLVRGRCPLCNYQVEDEPVTAPDTTPFAAGEGTVRTRWWRQTRYMWGAGSGRLSHLSLMQASPESRAYARRTMFPLILTVGLCWFLLTGWHAVKAVADAAGERLEPQGRGWFVLAKASIPPLEAELHPSRIVALWWNPASAAVGAAAALISAAILGSLLRVILRGGAERSMLRRHRGQKRLTAAWNYAPAWLAPLIPAGLILAVYPVARLSQVADWPIALPTPYVYVFAGIVAAVAVIMTWFGLVRLAATAPVRSRTRMLLFCGLWWPLLAAGLTTGALFGVFYLQRALSESLSLQW